MTAPRTDAAPRCLRCGRPDPLCYCRALVPTATRTHVVIFQHPRERTMKMGTARLAHLGLAGSELHVGFNVDEHPRLRALATAPRGEVALLYPDPDATSAVEPDPRPRTLVVVDGTWNTARKMIAHSHLLQALPRMSLRPALPSTYRIRREPAAHCLSTVEAVVAALVALEGDAGRFVSILDAFDRLVRVQLGYATSEHVPYYRERKRRSSRRRTSQVQALLAAAFDHLVVAQAEGNPHDGGGPHELVQLVAERLATGERFVRLVAPRYPLGAHTPTRLGLEAEALAAGASVEDLRAAWTGFLRADDVLVGWGGFTPAVLAADQLACPSWTDLRGELARHLGRRCGGAEEACRTIGAAAVPAGVPGRAGGRVAALAALVRALRVVPIVGNVT